MSRLRFYILLAIMGVGFGVFGVRTSQVAEDTALRDKAIIVLRDRIVALESHFIGHTVVLAKNGNGISIVPCKLNIDKKCFRDDTGISLSNLSISNMPGAGVRADGNGIEDIPHLSVGKVGTIKTNNSSIDGINFSYSGPSDWHYNLAWKMAVIKHAWTEFWNQP